MRRRSMITVVAVAVGLQAAAVLIYLRIESSRASPAEKEFLVERVEGAAPAPEVAMLTPDGETRRLSAWRGRRVLVHVWATWCGPCRKELPELLGLAGDLRRGGVDLVALSVDDGWEAVRGFFSSGIPDSVYRAIDRDYKAFGVRLLPTTFLVDEDGRIRLRIEGAREWESKAAHDLVRSAM